MTCAETCCSVCGLTDITHMHFGSQVCQACAAFFRRTVTLGIRFVCKLQKTCSISHGGRISCRACRFDRCESVGMKRELVQEPRGSNRIPKYVLRSREEGVHDIVRIYATSSVAPVTDERKKEPEDVEEEEEEEDSEFSSILNVTHEELLQYYIRQACSSSELQADGFGRFSLAEFLKRKALGDQAAVEICTSCPGTDLLDKDDLSILFRYSSFANLWMDSAWRHAERNSEAEKEEDVESRDLLSSFISRFSGSVGRTLSRLKLAAFEYAALKSFCIWKLAMLDSTLTLKTVSQEQYAGVTSALNRYYQTNTRLNPNEIATRMAELVLLLAPIFDAYRDILCVYESLGVSTDFEKHLHHLP